MLQQYANEINSVSISSFFVTSNRGCLLEYSHGVHKILLVDPLNKKTLLRMSIKTNVVLPFHIFVLKFYYKIYKEFLVYLIARLNLAINEQNEKFWYGINDKASIGEYGKELGRMGEYRKSGRVWMKRKLGNFW